MNLIESKFCLGDATEERRPPNTAQKKHVPKRSIQRRLRTVWETRLEMLLQHLLEQQFRSLALNKLVKCPCVATYYHRNFTMSADRVMRHIVMCLLPEI
jgi:hypothetical protein